MTSPTLMEIKTKKAINMKQVFKFKYRLHHYYVFLRQYLQKKITLGHICMIFLKKLIIKKLILATRTKYFNNTNK